MHKERKTNRKKQTDEEPVKWTDREREKPNDRKGEKKQADQQSRMRR